MRRRQQFLLHVGLALAALLLGWRLVAEWRRTNQSRYATPAQLQLASATLRPAISSNPTPLATGEIVAKNLFSPDRNSDLAQPEPLKPVPPPPVVFGTMNLGQHYEALMAEGAGGGSRAFRRVRTGEQIGDYRVIEIRDNQVEVEFQGQKTTLDVYQSAKSVPRQQTSTPAAAAPVVETAGSASPQPAASSPPPPTVSSPTSSGSGAGTAPDPHTRVTIEGNRRRVERQTPFGTQVWYEEIR
ncbi:MAG: hypothetical protein HY647_07890 [Acidobacteria bacterium]|nr:hypothetical protein [Acidobacteriota bacterium]